MNDTEKQKAVGNCLASIGEMVSRPKDFGYPGLSRVEAEIVNERLAHFEALAPNRGDMPRATVPEDGEYGPKSDIADIEAVVWKYTPQSGTTLAFAPGGAPIMSGGGYGSGDTGGFSGIGELMQSLYAQSKNLGVDARLDPLRTMAAAVGVGIGSEGGFAIPTQFVERTLREDLDDTVLLKHCDRQIMDKTKLLVPMFADKDHASSAPYGITWRQIPEGESFGDAQGTSMAGLQMTAHKSGSLFYVNNEWLDDSSRSMRSRLENIFSTSLRWYVESLLWSGTGAGEAMGALNAPGTLEIAKEGGQAADCIVVENIVKMWARLLPGSHGRALWAANATAFPDLATLSLAVGAGGSVTSLLQSNANSGIAGAPSVTMLGRPLLFSEHLPVLGSPGDITLLDPLMYLLGDRQVVTLDASQDYRFGHDQTAFRCKVRFDGQAILDDVFTPANGDTCGWAVTIADR